MNPNAEWQAFPEAVAGAELFRITQGPTDAYNSAFISRYLISGPRSGRLRPWIKIYPSLEPIIINVPFPEDLQGPGFLLYEVQIRRRLPFYPSPWNIEIEVFYE
ncbi:hypothetical protein HNI00_07260 [Thermoleptolyngbya oregonensis NK1-22]|uniref:Uncharacterized protein n=1 Tax=Thermoleptolyngbya oregonensis NK1-22 TaxID=2547457 RepID=A0AA96Y3Y1_9CYAN|nr:hypothetical protein [Thermoleptolyngbya oregonensis]WOB42974.1 hypothetical protein HNI00_07260 [Thermoleptolyngbya oregonensis NK1-22]